jgi:hypothetical protein
MVAYPRRILDLGLQNVRQTDVRQTDVRQTDVRQTLVVAITLPNLQFQ